MHLLTPHEPFGDSVTWNVLSGLPGSDGFGHRILLIITSFIRWYLKGGISRRGPNATYERHSLSFSSTEVTLELAPLELAGHFFLM
jgi:hypothetical protein